MKQPTILLLFFLLPFLGLGQINLDVPVGTSSPAIACSGASVELSATSLLGHTTFRWYESLLATEPLGEGNPYNSSPLFATTTFFVCSVDGNNVESIRTPVIVTVLPALDLPLAQAEELIICSGGRTTINVVAPNTYLTYYWYESINATTPLDSGLTYQTSSLTNTSIFYLASKNDNGCESIRTPVVITVIPTPDLPIVTNDDLTICSGKQTTLNATSLLGNTHFLWYNNLTDTSAFHEGSSYTTPSLYQTTIYFVSSVDSVNGCESLRVPATVVVTASIDVVVAVADEPIICSGTKTEINATSTLGNTVLNWYTSVTDSTALANGNSFTTPLLYETTTYFVASVSDEGCESARTPVIVTVLPNTDVPVVLNFPTVACENDTVRLTAYSQSELSVFSWYASDTSEVVLTKENPFYLPLNNDTTTIYVASKNIAGCESERVAVTIITKPYELLSPPDPVCNYNGYAEWQPVENAGNYEYKIGLNGNWERNFGTSLQLSTDEPVFLRSTSRQACISPQSESVELECFIINNIPNLITANNDGINDYWLLPQQYIDQNNQVEILNMNGKTIFSVRNYDNTSYLFGGSSQMAGTYFYRIYLVDEDKSLTGTLTVIR